MKQLLIDFVSQYISLSEDEKEALGYLNIVTSVKKGTILLEEGQISNVGYFVLKGCIRTYYVINGDEKTTGLYTEMERLIPQCVFNRRRSEYFVVCLEDSVISVSNPEMEEGIFKRYPKFETLFRILTEELLARQQMNFDEFRTSSPEKRYLNLYQNRPDLIQRVPQYQLASYLGIKPQSLSRLRSRIYHRNKQSFCST